MKIYGKLEMMAATLPENPQPGEVAYDSVTADLYIYVDGSWLSMTSGKKGSGLSSFIFNATGSPNELTWVIVHNLDTLNPVVQVYDNAGSQFIPDSIDVIDNNTVHVEVGTSIAGKAIILGGL